MRRTTVCAWMIFFLISASFTSCVSKKKWNELLNDKETLASQLTEEKAKVSSLEGEKAELEASNAQLESDKSQLSNDLSKAQSDLDAAQKNLASAQKSASENEAKVNMAKKGLDSAFAVYSNNGLSLTTKDGMLYLSNPIHYKSGSSRIEEAHNETLGKLAEVLKNNPEVNILVEGHTDDVPMKEEASYKSNASLSLARANRVINELVKLGVDRGQLVAIGRGSKMPVSTVEPPTEESRTQNRRTEFIIIADVNDLYKLRGDL